MSAQPLEKVITKTNCNPTKPGQHLNCPFPLLFELYDLQTLFPVRLASPLELFRVVLDIISASDIIFSLKRVLCGIVPEMNHSSRHQILVSYIMLTLRFPSPIYLFLASLLFLARLRTQLFCFKKSHQFFPPRVELCDILIAFHYFQKLPPPTPDLSLTLFLSPPPPWPLKVGRNSACCLFLQCAFSRQKNEPPLMKTDQFYEPIVSASGLP